MKGEPPLDELSEKILVYKSVQINSTYVANEHFLTNLWVKLLQQNTPLQEDIN